MIYYISAPCGSGKSEWAIKAASKLVAKGKCVLYVAPSVCLQAEIKKRFKKTPSVVINYKNTYSGIKSTIENELLHTNARVLIITHAAFKRITKFFNKKYWTVFIDEEMDVVDILTFNIQESHKYSTNIIEDILAVSNFKNHKEGYVSVTQNTSLSKEDRVFLKSISYTVGDIYPPFIKFVNYLFSKNIKLYADTSSIVTCKLAGEGDLEFWAELNTNIFSGFENLYLMGAQIQRSKICKYFMLKGIAIKELKIPIKFNVHPQPITIQWMTSHYPWSKQYYMEKNIVEPSITNFELYDILVGNSIGDEPILLQNNKGLPFTHIKYPIYMNYEVKGLNQYMIYNHYSESGAYNVPPAYYKRMCKLGFDMEDLQLYHAISHAYQGFCRSSIRDGKFHNNVIFLPTKQMAESMRNIYFPNAIVKQIDEATYFFKGNKDK